MPELINREALELMLEGIVRNVTNAKMKHLEYEIELLKRAKSIKPVMSVEEAAGYACKSVHTIRQWAKNGIVPYFREGKNIYFNTDDINDYLTKIRFASQEEIDIEAESRIKKLSTNRKHNDKIRTKQH